MLIGRARRAARLGLCLLALGSAGMAMAAGSGDSPRLATLDWGIAQNLTAMGVAPVAVGQIDGYADWVGTPALPPGTHELGLRSEPNLELLAQLAPDRILITRMYASMAPKLSRVAPVSTVDVYSTPGNVWHNSVAAVKKLGCIAQRPGAADALIQRTEKHIHRAAARLPDDIGPLLILQFVDAQHVRIYGHHSLIQATLQRMGVANAWQGPTTRWGVAVVPLSRLARIKTGRVVVMGPVPMGVTDTIASSRIWQSLPIVANAPVRYMPAVWSTGGLPSASRFARLLARAFQQAPANAPGWPRTRASS